MSRINECGEISQANKGWKCIQPTHWDQWFILLLGFNDGHILDCGNEQIMKGFCCKSCNQNKKEDFKPKLELRFHSWQPYGYSNDKWFHVPNWLHLDEKDWPAQPEDLRCNIKCFEELRSESKPNSVQFILFLIFQKKKNKIYIQIHIYKNINILSINSINSFGTRKEFLNDPSFDEYDPMQVGLSFPRGHFTFSEKQSINYKILIFLSST